MQSVLRTCFELQAWLPQVHWLRGFPLGTLLRLRADSNESDLLLSSIWRSNTVDYTLSKNVTPDHSDKHKAHHSKLLATASQRASTLDWISRKSFFNVQHPARLYNVQPEPGLTTCPPPLQERLRRVAEQTIPDDELREVWRDILESFGDGQRGLPVTGNVADKIWDALICLGAKDITIMEELCGYSSRLWEIERRERPTFYADVISALIKSQQHASALRFHKELSRKLDIGPEDLLRVFRDTCSTPDDYSSFQVIYATAPKMHIHDSVIGHLCVQSKVEEAMRMHTFLMDRKDYPENVELLYQLYVYAMSQGSEMVQVFRKRLVKANIRVFEDSVAPGLGNSKAGFSDSFVAKLLATPSFSANFISGTIATFGTTELGPLAVQELCQRSQSVADLAKSVRVFTSRRIWTRQSTLGKLVDRIVETKDEFLLSMIKSSDIHPDALDDLEWQKSRLVEQHRRSDFVQIRYTRAVLRIHTFEDGQVLTLLLRDDLSSKVWDRASDTLATMTRQQRCIPTETLEWIVNEVLDPDSLSSEFVQDAARFSVQLCGHLPLTKNRVPIRFLVHPMQILGRAGRLTELERLLYWLASKHTLFGIRRKPASSKSYVFSTTDFKRLFSKEFQRDLVLWGFEQQKRQRRGAYRPMLDLRHGTTDTQTDPWTFGIRLLSNLRNRLHVPVQHRVVREALLSCLAQLVMELHSDHLDLPKERLTLMRAYAKLANELWGSELLSEAEPRFYDLLFRELEVFESHAQRTVTTGEQTSPDSDAGMYERDPVAWKQRS